MTIKFLSHTADVKIQIQAKSIEEIFNGGVKAIYQYLKPIILDKEKIDKIVAIEAKDLTALFIDFLSEVLALTYIEKALFEVKKLQITNVKLPRSKLRRIYTKLKRFHAEIPKNEQSSFFGISALSGLNTDSDGPIRLDAKLEGTKFKKLTNDIKAITYHQAEIRNENGKYIAQFVIDV
jgi:SHS2 domain-containing protein